MYVRAPVRLIIKLELKAAPTSCLFCSLNLIRNHNNDIEIDILLCDNDRLFISLTQFLGGNSDGDK